MNEDQLRFENACVLDTVQALFGEITPQMRAITLDADHERNVIRLHVAASEPIDEEVIHDLTTEVNAIAGWECDVYVDQWVGTDWGKDWPHRGARAVYAARVEHPEEEE